MFGRTASRRVVLVFKASFRLILAGLTLYVVWWEFKDIFQSSMFIYILMAWFVYAVIFFMDDWVKAKDDTVENKLDKINDSILQLTEEIRKDRNERKNSN
ncbi:hypothetical protein ACFLWL_00260 [Chloroflexota bacterium]